MFEAAPEENSAGIEIEEEGIPAPISANMYNASIEYEEEDIPAPTSDNRDNSAGL